MEEHRELDYFLEDPTHDTLARRFGQDFSWLTRELITEKTSETSGQALRNVLDGRRRGQPVWAVLQGLGRTERDRALLAEGCGGKEPYQLLLDYPVTFTGRVDRPVICTQRRTSEYLALADIVRKRVAFEVVAAGWQLVAVIEDELIIEVPDESRNLDEEVVPLVERTASQQPGELADGCCGIREIPKR